MAYNYKLIDFLSTKNVVEIQNEDDFEEFKKVLNKAGLLDILYLGNKKEKCLDFEYWWKLALMNTKTLEWKGIYLEYDNQKGITFYTERETPIKWYGCLPIQVKHLFCHK